MASHYKRPESVLVLVVTRQAEVLLLERLQPEGFWQSVTCSMAWDETEPLQTAQRELFEETGIKSTALVDCHKSHRLSILPQWRSQYAPKVEQNLEHIFTLELEDQCDIVLNPEEHRAWQWLTKDQAMATASSWTNRAAIRDLLRVAR